MRDSEPHKEYYNGFQIVAKFYQGKLQGSAWHLVTKKKRFSANGTTIGDIVLRLKGLVDADVAENIVFYRESIARKHREFLASIGMPDRGQGTVSRFGRWSHCYNCKGPVTNVFDLECNACGWIICSYCAACGCGYMHTSSDNASLE